MRAALLVSVAVLAFAAPAQAQERLCPPPSTPPKAPTSAERDRAELQGHANRRAEFGFRHDLAYVNGLLERGESWQYDRTDFMPVTRRERRYLERRLEIASTDVYRYLERHRGLSGGASVKDAWPKDPYLLVRVTRDPAKHLAALRRLLPYDVRVKKVRHSEAELRRAADAINRDDDALREAGFVVADLDVDFDAGRTRVELGTARADAAAYFAQRYGPLVQTAVVATSVTKLECRRGESFEIAPDGRTLTLSWSGSADAVLERIEMVEHADRVEVGVVERVSTGPSAEGVIGRVPVTLAAPLGVRPVIDAESGTPMRQVGPAPGDPPCPTAPPPAPFTPLDEAIAMRRVHGMRADLAYVRQRLASGEPFTRAEERWLDLRSAIWADRDRVEAYTAEHADEYGGSTIEAKYPARPYVVYRWTAHRARHAAALRRLSEHPDRVRTAPARYSVQEVSELEERVRGDWSYEGAFFDGYGRAGLYVRSVRADEQAVHIGVITTRTDAAAYFTARYGPIVRVEVVGDRFECPELPPAGGPVHP